MNNYDRITHHRSKKVESKRIDNNKKREKKITMGTR